jgi:hypothetical protein
MGRLFVLGVFCLTILLSGCETTKAVAKGFAQVGQGFCKDVGNTWGNIQQMDRWLKKNLW